MNKKLNTVLSLLRSAFIVNAEAHELSEKSQECYYCWDHRWAADYSSEKSFKYWRKSKLIQDIIILIKKYKLPIKYGYWKEWNTKNIIYFSFNDEQMSFHSFWSFKWIKKYNWNWKWVKNSSKILDKFK